MKSAPLLLGVDGGGTHCRARLCTREGVKLGEAVTGPANLRLGLDQSIKAVLQATRECLEQAGLSSPDQSKVAACLALAGAGAPAALEAARASKLPFASTMFTTDARAACVGAHRGHVGGVIVVGTGTIGWAELGSRPRRVGGWGLPISDEGSGAWLGGEALRRVLWAYDGRIRWTKLLQELFDRFARDPHSIVSFATKATPREFGAFAPLAIEYASRKDPAGVELMELAACHIDELAERLVACGAGRLVLIGGLASHMSEWISPRTRAHLVPPAGDAVDGALLLARSIADEIAA